MAEAKRRQRRPQRMCAVCRKRLAKPELIRFVFAEGRVPVEDSKQVLPGRGCYVCAVGGCKEKWLRRATRK